MEIVREANRMQEVAMRSRIEGKLIGLVPTSGFLHNGHKRLIERAKEESDIVVVSCFVNSKEFGPNEDYQRYPRDSDHDAAFCRENKVDYLFQPSADELFPSGFSTTVQESAISEKMCGVSRPHYFKGVCTYHTKLFNLVRPDNVVLGQKDAQKSAVIRKMVNELNFPLTVMMEETVREADGLACGARNAYLNDYQRRDAVVLYNALKEGKKLAESGIRNVDRVLAEVAHHISLVRRLRLIYVVAVNPDTMENCRSEIQNGGTLLTASVWCDEVRLIDCVML